MEIKMAEQEKTAVEEPPLKGKYYLRTGGCNGCGQCCTNIYLVNGDKTIETVEEFELLKAWDREYIHFKPVESTEHGVMFQCINLLPDNQCAIYTDRPSFCRRYPMENTLLAGGTISADCGYRFELLKTFQDVMAETGRRKKVSLKQH